MQWRIFLFPRYSRWIMLSPMMKSCRVCTSNPVMGLRSWKHLCCPGPKVSFWQWQRWFLHSGSFTNLPKMRAESFELELSGLGSAWNSVFKIFFFFSMGKPQMHPLCFRMGQFPPLSHSSPKSRISCETKRSIFDLIIYRHLTSVLHTWNTINSSTCKQLKILYGFEPTLLLCFL